MEGRVQGVTVPRITCINDFGWRDESKTSRDLFFMVNLNKSCCPCETITVPAVSLVKTFGRPWTTTMLERYAVTVSEEAANEKHSLQQFTKNQLLSILSFAREKRFKLDAVFDASLQHVQKESIGGNKKLCSNLNTVIGLPDRLFKNIKKGSSPHHQASEPITRTGEAVNTEDSDCPTDRTEERSLKEKCASLESSVKPSRRKIRPPRDERIYALSQSNRVQGLSTKKHSQKPKLTTDPVEAQSRQQPSLGKRHPLITLISPLQHHHKDHHHPK